MDKEKIKKQTLAIVQHSESITLKTQEDVNSANEFIQKIGKSIKEIKAIFKPANEKAYQSWKESVALRDNFIIPREKAREIIKKKIADFLFAVDKEAKIQAQKISEETGITIIAAPVIEKPKGFSITERWKGRVVDFKILPDEYKLVNQSAIDSAINTTKGKISIPGVEPYRDDVAKSR